MKNVSNVKEFLIGRQTRQDSQIDRKTKNKLMSAEQLNVVNRKTQKRKNINQSMCHCCKKKRKIVKRSQFFHFNIPSRTTVEKKNLFKNNYNSRE